MLAELEPIWTAYATVSGDHSGCEADYREKLRELKEQLERVDAAPDERRMMTAIKLAQDLAAAWELARPERRKQLVAQLFETVRVGGGRIVSVKPKPAVTPLVVVTMTDTGGNDWRSRPGSEPPVFVGGIAVEASKMSLDWSQPAPDRGR